MTTLVILEDDDRFKIEFGQIWHRYETMNISVTVNFDTENPVIVDVDIKRDQADAIISYLKQQFNL